MGNNISNFNSNSKKRTSKSKGTKDTLDQIINNQSSSPIKDFKYQYKVDEFAMRSLNKYKNFLTAPDCECGCGDKSMPILEDDDVYDFCGCVLSDIECDNCAIFLVHKDGKQEIVHKHIIWDEDTDDEEVSIDVLSTKNKKDDLEIDFFAKVDAMLQFHHYALLLERDNNVWDICE